MKETIQKTLTGEILSPLKETTSVSLADVLLLPLNYLLSITNLQKLLFLSSFLTYGVGDGITAAYMMERVGVVREINPVARFVFASHGAQGVIGIKIWFAFLILFFVWLISRKSESYWAVNGFLSALFLGGIMAIRANMMAVYGLSPPSPNSIIMTFLFLTVLFVMIGDLIDKLHHPAKSSHMVQVSSS